jgi:hypothetical protein
MQPSDLCKTRPGTSDPGHAGAEQVGPAGTPMVPPCAGGGSPERTLPPVPRALRDAALEHSGNLYVLRPLKSGMEESGYYGDREAIYVTSLRRVDGKSAPRRAPTPWGELRQPSKARTSRPFLPRPAPNPPHTCILTMQVEWPQRPSSKLGSRPDDGPESWAVAIHVVESPPQSSVADRPPDSWNGSKSLLTRQLPWESRRRSPIPRAQLRWMSPPS